MPIEQEQEHFNIQEQIQRYTRTLKERWYSIAVITTVALLIGYGLAQLWPESYESSTLFVLRESQIVVDESSLERALKPMKLGVKQYTLQKEIRSSSRLKAVLRELEWKEYIVAQMNPRDEAIFYGRVREALNVSISESVTGDTQVTISFVWHDKYKAAAFCETMRDNWIESKIAYYQENCQNRLERANMVLKQRLEEKNQTQKKLEEFDQDAGYAFLGTLEANYGLESELILSVNRDKSTVESQGGLIAGLEKQLAEIPPKIIMENKKKNAAYTKASNKVQAAMKQLQMLEQRLAPAHPDLIKVRDDVDAAMKEFEAVQGQEYIGEGFTEHPNVEYTDKKNLLDTARIDYEGARNRLRLNEELLAVVRLKISQLPRIEAERSSLLANIDLVTEEYQKAYQEIQPLKVRVDSFMTTNQRAGTWQTENNLMDQAFELLGRAIPAPSPENPMTLILLGISLVVGIGLGLAFPLLREVLKSSFTNPDEVFAYLRKPVLGAVSLIITESDLKAMRWRKIIYTSSSLILIFSLVAIIYICHQHPQLIPPEVIDKVNQIREALS